MYEPLTAAEIDDIRARLRVDRPLHWHLARRLLYEVLRLRTDRLPPPPPPAPEPEPDPEPSAGEPTRL
ncbi:MAG: hypothetical protein EP329_25135 [Deltaproteobacteria bacterium]|nr:MAG: hypothetical protein EP329_25135 [Deltaproteobacteria bacterium]